jgi:hypothetical protein
VLGDELRVEQGEPAMLEAAGEVNQGDLGRVALAMKHRLAEEGGSEPHAVKPADQAAVEVGFDRVAVAKVEQFAVETADAGVDPGPVAPFPGRGAMGRSRRRSRGRPDLEPIGADVRARRFATRKPSSGITPRSRGSTQNRLGSSASSAMGKMPAA